MKIRYVLALSLPFVLAFACNKPKQEQNAAQTAAPIDTSVSTPEDPQSQAKALFKGRCSVCHGETGSGDGPGSAALNPKPRAFQDATWQTSVTDEHLTKVIVEGGAAVGKSPAMPGNPDLQEKPDVVKALVAIVRGYKK